MAMFHSMNNIPGQRGYIDERVRFVMRGDVVNSILAEISRAHRRTQGGGVPESTRRPSASVLSTSTDLPFIVYMLDKLSALIGFPSTSGRTRRQVWWRSDRASSQ